MKIRIEIGELVVHGFDYHDHRRIGAAIEWELTRLISKNGLPQGISGNKEIPKIDAGSFNIDRHTNPRAIGAEVAKSIYRAWNSKNQRHI